MIDVNLAKVGDLVMTDDGYPGIIRRRDGNDLVVRLGNGLTVEYTLRQVEIQPLKDGADSPANFAEILEEPGAWENPKR